MPARRSTTTSPPSRAVSTSTAASTTTTNAITAACSAAPGRLTSDVTSDAGTRAGEIHLDVQTVGGYWTHFGDSGWYIDGLAQFSWLDAEMRSDRMTLNTNGTSPAASLEGGYPFALGKQTVLEPEAQVVYQRITFDSARDTLATIMFEDATSLVGRLGLRLARTWRRDGTRISTTWGRVNVWKEFEGESRIDIIHGRRAPRPSAPISGTRGSSRRGRRRAALRTVHAVRIRQLPDGGRRATATLRPEKAASDSIGKSPGAENAGRGN